MLKRLVETSGGNRIKNNEYHQGKCNYPLHSIFASIKSQVTGTVLG